MSYGRESGRARWVMGKVEQFAPRGSLARAAVTSGRGAALEARSFVARSRWRWRWSRSPAATTPSYLEWLDGHRPGSDALGGERARVREAGIRIGVHCVIVGGGDGAAETVAALKRQTFPTWTATLVGGRAPVMAPASVSVAQNEAEALRAAVADGSPNDFVLVLEAGDVPEPDFLFNVAARGWDNPSLDLVHWDDDLLDESGRAHIPLFRPSWSPEMLLSANYLGRSFAVRRRRLASAGGFGERRGDGRWWELLLRLGLNQDEVARVARVLVHLRRRPSVTSAEAVELVGEQLAHAGREAEIVAAERGSVRVRWALPQPPKVSIVIPSRNRETLLAHCMDSLARTDYPDFEVVVVDSGGRDASSERWYRERGDGFPIEVVWWEGEFNYSAANNAAARAAKGELIVFLNDDTEIVSPDWLRELVGWAVQPDIGLVGLRLLDGSGAIQHGGVVVGMTGFGGHLFAGMQPGEESIFGSTDWYRNCLSVTAACVCLEHKLFEQIGGFDERFLLCGSDVVLGLDARFHGRRSLCSPFAEVRHLESETRGENVPPQDFFTSYWRYQRWLKGGDPYFSPSLSLQSPEPVLRGADEPSALEVVGGVLGRSFSVFRQSSTEKESAMLADQCRADRELELRVREGHREDSGPIKVHTVNWFLPEIDNPFYGGINTALRIAERLALEHGVKNQFVVAADANEAYIRSAIDAAFPAISDSLIAFSNGTAGPNLDSMPPADVSIGTQWHTSYLAAHFPHTRRRFYLIQDFEPMFYPAGTNYALAEESYRLGLYGICNTEHMRALYERRYGGDGMSFMPAVDGSVFHAEGRAPHQHDGPVTIFTYARPGHWRNCWELASPALSELKRRLGQDIRIVTAGSWAHPDDLGRGIEHLGLLDYRDTGKLYRQCDIGIALTVSEHPSYLPLELLACGTPVVAFDNPAGDWIVHHEENSIRVPRTIDGLLEGLEGLATDPALRQRLSSRGLEDIAAGHGDWPAALSGIYDYLCDPAAGS